MTSEYEEAEGSQQHLLGQSFACTSAIPLDAQEEEAEKENAKTLYGGRDFDEDPVCVCCCKRSTWWNEFWVKWKYVILMIILANLRGIAGILVYPVLPGIKKDYFGGDKEAAFYQTILDVISASLGLVLAPVSGLVMDIIGRRPFFLFAVGINLVPPVLLLSFYPDPLPQMISMAVANLVIGSFTAAYIADHYQGDKARVLAYAFVLGGGTFHVVFGLVVSSGINTYLLLSLSVGVQALALIFVYFFVDESLPQHILDERRVSGFNWRDAENPFTAMKSVLNSKISIATVLVMGMFTVSQDGIGEVYFYYLNDKLNMTKGDNAMMLLIAGLTWPIVMFLGVPFFKKVLGLHSVTTVMVSVAFLCAEMIVMCVCTAKWQIFALALPFAGLVNMSFPALNALIAAGSNGEDQGRRQAGLAAIKDFCGALAPLFFGQIYSHVDKFWSFLPFAIAAALCVPTLGLAAKLRQWVVVQGLLNRTTRSRSSSVNNSVNKRTAGGATHDIQQLPEEA